MLTPRNTAAAAAAATSARPGSAFGERLCPWGPGVLLLTTLGAKVWNEILPAVILPAFRGHIGSRAWKQMYLGP